MINSLLNQPAVMWIAALIALAATVQGFRSLFQGYGLPLLAAIATAVFWYVGDVLYNDYDDLYASLFISDVRQNAWLEVSAFFATLFLAVPVIHRRFNSELVGTKSRVMDLVENGHELPGLQRMLPAFLRLCATIWVALILVAIVRLGLDAIHFVFPVFGKKLSPFGRSRVGGGFSALLSLGHNLHLLVAAGFGLIWALSSSRSDRTAALAGMATTWPYFIFDRTRHLTLMVCVPTVLAYVFVRMRATTVKKIVVLGVALLVIDGWFRLVMEARSARRSVFDMAFAGSELEDDDAPNARRHQGLNMFEELCWINKFIEDGSYRVNWGERYFAELVNPIPRGLWPGKPLAGIDYAIARGQGQSERRYSAAAGGVNATISTGLIGQGVVNFGRILGPVAAALIVSIWIAFLAKLDLQGQLPGRLPLYGLGLVSTFNMGRDVTLIDLYPMLFGYLFLRVFVDSRSSA